MQKTEPANEPASPNTEETDQCTAIMEALLPFIRAAQGLPGEEPVPTLGTEIERLRQATKRSSAWIYRKVAQLSKRPLAEITWRDFTKGQSNGGAGKYRLPAPLANALQESIRTLCVQGGMPPRRRATVDAILARMATVHQLDRATLPKRPTIAKWAEREKKHASEQAALRSGAQDRPAVMHRVFLDWTTHRPGTADTLVVLASDSTTPLGPANLVLGAEEVTLLPWGWLWVVDHVAPDHVAEAMLRGLFTKQPLLRPHYDAAVSVAGRPTTITCGLERRLSNELVKVLREHDIQATAEATGNLPSHLPTIAAGFYGLFVSFLRGVKEVRKLTREILGAEDGKRLCVTYADLERHWLTWIANHYLKQSNPWLGNETPEKVYRTRVPTGAGNVLPLEVNAATADRPAVRWPFLRTSRRKINHMGIELRNRFYSAKELRALFLPGRRNSRQREDVRSSWVDLQRVYVKVADRVLEVPLRVPKVATAKLEPGQVNQRELLLRCQNGCTEWEWQHFFPKISHGTPAPTVPRRTAVESPAAAEPPEPAKPPAATSAKPDGPKAAGKPPEEPAAPPPPAPEKTPSSAPLAPPRANEILLRKPSANPVKILPTTFNPYSSLSR